MTLILGKIHVKNVKEFYCFPLFFFVWCSSIPYMHAIYIYLLHIDKEYINVCCKVGESAKGWLQYKNEPCKVAVHLLYV